MTTFCALDTAPPFHSPPLRVEAERVEFQFPDFHREDINLNETAYIARGVLCQSLGVAVPLGHCNPYTPH